MQYILINSLLIGWTLVVTNGNNGMWETYPNYRNYTNCQRAATKINAQNLFVQTNQYNNNVTTYAFCIVSK